MTTQMIFSYRFRTTWSIIFTLLASYVLNTAASPTQYCVVDKKHNTDQCIVVSSQRNVSSGQNDVHLFFSAKFEDRKGYAAFGTGTFMDGSLMFVFYPGDEPGGTSWTLKAR